MLRFEGPGDHGSLRWIVWAGFRWTPPPGGDQDSPASIVFLCCWVRGLGPPGDQLPLVSARRFWLLFKFCSRRGCCTGSESHVSSELSVSAVALVFCQGGFAHTSGFFFGIFQISWKEGLLFPRFCASNLRFSFRGPGFEGPVAGVAGSDCGGVGGIRWGDGEPSSCAGSK